MKKEIYNGIIQGISIFITLGICFVSYAAWTNITTKSDGQTINAIAWNELVNNINDIGAKIDTYTGNNSSIWSTGPNLNISLNGRSYPGQTNSTIGTINFTQTGVYYITWGGYVPPLSGYRVFLGISNQSESNIVLHSSDAYGDGKHSMGYFTPGSYSLYIFPEGPGGTWVGNTSTALSISTRLISPLH